jgi:translation initiation factor 1 (eIF-1/SUI1)
MDPFSQNINNDISFEEDNIVTITIEHRGRKTNTYITGWNLDSGGRKEHLKNLKKTFGCNGSVKTFIIDSIETPCIHLQGEHTEKIKQYLEENNVSNITVKE